jgi:hypothetical protein
MDNLSECQSAERKAVLRGWVYVCGLALIFLLYGLFMFYMIGDKGPPGWDFGTVEDVPGQSIYSTHSGAASTLPDPEPQHVSERPSLAVIDAERGKK